MQKIKVKKLNPEAIIPSYGHPGDAGLDIYSAEDFVLTHEMRHAVSTGISMELPEGYVALVWDKSGLAAKKGITVLGGVIDAHYRGEYKIILYNTEIDDFIIRKGDKIAQVLIQPIETAIIEEVNELSETSRGEGRFGSTGGSNI
ncbi:MAG: dUTP diphosphatase [archaeon]